MGPAGVDGPQPHCGAGQAPRDWGTGLGSGHSRDQRQHQSSGCTETWCGPGVARATVPGWGLRLAPPREQVVVAADLPEGGVRAFWAPVDIGNGRCRGLSGRKGWWQPWCALCSPGTWFPLGKPGARRLRETDDQCEPTAVM